MGIFKQKATIVLIAILAICIGWTIKDVYFPSPEAKKIREKVAEISQQQKGYNEAWRDYVLGEASDRLKNDPNTEIKNVRCFNENKACFFAVILDFASKPANYEEVIKKYTQELAEAKAAIYTEPRTLLLTVVGKFSESEGYTCKIDSMRSQKDQPFQHLPQCDREDHIQEF